MTYSATILATSGLVSYWRLGDAGPTPVVAGKDSNNGTALLAPTFGSTGLLTGDADKAMTFVAASSQNVAIPHNANIDWGDGPVSFEAWIKPTTVSIYQAIVSSPENSLEVRIGSGNGLEVLKNNVALIVTSTNAFAAGSIYHVVVTKNGATTKQYVNGVDVTGTVTDATLANSTFGMSIASRAGFSDDYFNGIIDEVAVYNAALSAATVLDHYNVGIGNIAPVGGIIMGDLISGWMR